MTGNRRVTSELKMNNWLRKLFLLSFFLRGRRKMWYKVFYDEMEHCDLKRFIPCNLGSENLKGQTTIHDHHQTRRNIIIRITNECCKMRIAL